ncbi:MAG: NADP-dependent malic enzyme [Caldilineae bacterium]|nr:MAG: NADP-dependent malic enzyme [Caldilineae bacterium]
MSSVKEEKAPKGRAPEPSEVEALLARAKKPAADAMVLHPFYKGKMETVPKCAIRDFHDFAIWYTPGVAQPCRAIHADPEQVYEHTNKGNLVAVVSDGTRVLGLGDIGAKAAIPVMEGKALLYKYLGGVDAVSICVDTKDPDELIRTVLLLQPNFGGINLEDISQPKCFYILDTLRERAEIPVWHDDQQGTATVALAGLINALHIVGKKMEEIRVVFLGCGASNVACSRLMFAAGVKPENCIAVDSKGILHPEREDLRRRKAEFVDKWRIANTTNKEGRRGGTAEALRGADVCIALSKPGPGTLDPKYVAQMAEDAIVFAMANPIPEMWPWEAKEAGVRIFATGRSDFPNQVNNSLGFPGIFRGALDVRARTITDEMCIAAANALAEQARERGLDEEYILPTMDEWEVFPREAVAVGMKAQEQGVARLTLTAEELYRKASDRIARSRELTQWMMKQGYIPEPPEV